MRLPAASLALAVALTGCTRTSSSPESQTKPDADRAAYNVGKAARVAADKTEKAAKVAGEKIRKAAKSAEQGWKDSKPK